MPVLDLPLPTRARAIKKHEVQSRRILVCVTLMSLGLWAWLLTETFLFLYVVKNIQNTTQQLQIELESLVANKPNLNRELLPIQMRRNFTSSDGRAVHFQNVEISIALNADGAVRYWIPNRTISEPSQLEADVDFRMSSDGSRVVLSTSGLYMVYAQLDWDLDQEEVGQLRLSVGGKSSPTRVLATCTMSGKAIQGSDEKSCYTSAVTYLHRQQQIWVSSYSPGAQINGAPDKSFFGLVRL